MSPILNFIIYVIVFAVGNGYAIATINKRRRQLDLTKPEDVKKDKTSKLISIILLIETVILSIVFYFVFFGK